MKKIILLLAAFFCLTNNYAQTINNPKLRDSLKILLQTEKQDTRRVNLLAQLANTYQNNKPDTAMILALEALSLSKRIGFVKGEAASLNAIGGAYRIMGNSPKAMEVWLSSLKLNEKNNNLNDIVTNLSNLGGLIYFEQGEYHKSIDYLLKAKKLQEQLNINGGGLILLRLGRSYLRLKQLDSARFYAQQSYELSRKSNSIYEIGAYFSLMGTIYSETGQKKLALEYYRQSIPYVKLSETTGQLSHIFLSMAKLFENEGQMDSTLFYANRSFGISRGVGKFTVGVRNASKFLSSFYKKRGNVDSAFFYLEVATLANDSLFSQEKINKFQSLSFDEKLRQQEIALGELKSKEERKNNLQFAALAIGLITFIILFFALSRSIIVKTKFIEFFGVLGLLAVFEFINLFIHPYLAHLTNDSPVLMLGVLIAIGALLIPLHHKLEQWMTKVMVEKNKRIRLEAARKTIVQLEGTN